MPFKQLRFNKKQFFCLLIGSMSLFSCQFSEIGFDEVKVEEWEPQFATALFSSEIKVADVIAEVDSQFFQVRDDDVIEFVYEGEIVSFDVTDLVPSLDRSISRSFSPIPPGVIAIPTTLRFNESTEISFDVDPVELYSMETSNGNIGYTIASNYDFPISITLTFPDVIDQNGTALSQNINLNPNDSRTGTFSLAPATIDFTQLTPNYNRILASYQIEVPPTASPVTVQANDAISINLSINNIESQVVRCNLGQQAIPIEGDSIGISLYQNSFKGADISIDSGQILFEVINNYGVPFDFEFNTLLVHDIENATDLAVQLSENPFAMAGSSTKDDLEVTNLSELFNFRPDELRFEPTITINPNNTASINNPNVIRANSDITINTKIQVPLIGSGDVDINSDTSGIDLSLEQQIDQFEFATVRTVVKNNIPVASNLQFYFLDEQDNIVDSLFSAGPYNFPAAPVDSEGLTSGISEETVEVDISKDRLNNLLNTRKVFVAGTFQTTENAPFVKFRNSDFIDLNIGVITNLKLSID